MVRGPSPGPAPAAQARAGSSRLTRSSWRTWPHRKLRRKVPRVDGALTVPPRVQAVPPVRKHIGVVDAVAAGHALRPPGSSACLRCWPAPARRPGQGDGQRVPAGPDAGRGWPAGADRHWPPGGDRQRRYGYGRAGCVVASIGCSFLWHCFAVTKPLSQIQKSTLWPLQDANPTPSLGGFGLRGPSSMLNLSPPQPVEATKEPWSARLSR